MKFYSIEEAEKQNLIQLTESLVDNYRERKFVEKTIQEVLDDILEQRTAIPVKDKDGLISVWVNDLRIKWNTKA
jgi:hypothetical protein